MELLKNIYLKWRAETHNIPQITIFLFTIVVISDDIYEIAINCFIRRA